MNTKKTDERYFGRDKSKDLEVTGSQGSYLFGADGKKYIDFLGGWCVGNIGWNNKEVQDAIKHFNGPSYVHPSLYYKPWAELARLLAEITPGDLKVSYRTTGGSESVEAAMQIAMIATKRSKFLSIEDSYHGNTIGTLSIGASSNRDTYGNLLQGCYKIKPPFNKKTAEKVEARLEKKDIAAFIMEPVICNLGVKVPDQEFMQTVQKLCKKYGTLFIMDEVATGFGRTGKLFATEHFDIQPDVMTMSKAITGGQAGMGAVIVTEKIAKKIEKDFSFYSTYGWHPLSVAAAIANINYIIKHRNELLNNVNEMSELFHARLSSMRFKHDIEINIKGLAISVDTGKANYAKKVQEKCLQAGLLLNAEETNLSMFPALNIERDVVEEGLDILEKCI